ncbi:MAG: VCBS repeat-containing protein [archaeon]
MRFYHRMIALALLVTTYVGLAGCEERRDVIPNDKAVAFADVNNDGLQDLIYAQMLRGVNEDPEKNNFYDWDLFLALGHSGGRFSPGKKIAKIGMPPNDLQARDLNGDGNADISYLVMKPGFTGADSRMYDWGLMVMGGRGDGTFEEPVEAYNFDKAPGVI